jgi:hypothetical protein
VEKKGWNGMKNILGFLLLGCVFLSCATGSFARIDGAVDSGNYSRGITILEDGKKSFYPNRDLVLYYLDKGMLSHYAGLYKDSSQLLEGGERAIEEAFTKSVTAEISTYLLNDNTREYAGEDYEDIYINVFNSLNYYYQGDNEGALVEIRRLNNKTRYLASKYGVILSNLQKKALEESAEVPPDPNAESQFTDSALARYLGMLFYRSAGLYDDARIDKNFLRTAFANAPHVYSHPVPSSVEGELDIPPGMARLNVLGFSGLSPVKEEVTLRIPIPPSQWVKLAQPEMIGRSSQIGRIEVIFDDGQRFDLELLEDIEAVARETFKTKRNIIYLKTVIRSTLKGTTSSALGVAAGEAEGETGLALAVLSLATQVFAEMSEQADLRISRYFPAKAWAGGINVSPGVYSFRINYYNHSGKTAASFRYEDVNIEEHTLNLMEAVCLK